MAFIDRRIIPEPNGYGKYTVELCYFIDSYNGRAPAAPSGAVGNAFEIAGPLF
jgi:hypothetical protein